MEGKIKEGDFKMGEKWVRVRRRHYPRERFVFTEIEGPGGECLMDDTPEVTPERWAEMEGWL